MCRCGRYCQPLRSVSPEVPELVIRVPCLGAGGAYWEPTCTMSSVEDAPGMVEVYIFGPTCTLGSVVDARERVAAYVFGWCRVVSGTPGARTC